MRKMGQKGIATVAVVIAIVASAGGTIATPVVVDSIDVDPDHPLYGLERLGERIRLVGNEDQMKERWVEYYLMVERGKGLRYRDILEEFRDKLRDVIPENAEMKQEIVRWMQEQMPGIGLVQLKLQGELARKLRDILPELREEVENEIGEIENLKEMLPEAEPELRENIRAHLRLIRERLENIARHHPVRVRPLFVYFDIDNLLIDVDITANVEVKINVIRPLHWTAGFENTLSEFENLLIEVQAMLEGAPENAPGRHAAERLVEVAIKLRDRAVAAYENNRIRNALGLIHAAKIHLRNAAIILEHGSEWEPRFAKEWICWKDRWRNLIRPILVSKKEQVENLIKEIWKSVPENWGEHFENMKEEWQRKWQEKWQETGEEVIVQGVLQKSETTVWMYGTHLLAGKENGEILYALKSGTVNLDMYIGEPVQVEGTKIHSGLALGPPYLNVENVTPLETPAQ